MAKSSKSPYAILGMLALLKKSSGYDLKKHMAASTEYFWKETYSSIYPVLESLEKQRLIEKVTTTRTSDRKRNVYALTPQGHAIFKEWLQQPAESMQLRNELLLKLFFGGMMPPEMSIKQLEQQKKELKSKLATYQEIKKELEALDTQESLYSLLTLDHGIRLTSCSLDWCDNAIKTLIKLDRQRH
ncbi:MAG: PadR family transcriptional regulator [Candidatus Babeliales bacterium]